MLDAYRFTGYRPRADVRGVFGDPRAKLIQLERTQKKFVAVVVRSTGATTTRRYVGYRICPVGVHREGLTVFVMSNISD